MDTGRLLTAQCPLLDDELPLESAETDGFELQANKLDARRALDAEEEDDDVLVNDAEDADEDNEVACGRGEGVGDAPMAGELQLDGELGSGKEVSPTAASVARCCSNWAAAAANIDPGVETGVVAAGEGGSAANPGGLADAGGLGKRLFG